MIKLVIFDMDGTLMDTETLSFECFRRSCLEEGIELTKEFYANVIGSSHDILKRKFIGEYGSNMDYDRIYQKRNQLFYESMESEGVVIKKGYQKLREYLNINKIKSAVATSTPKRMTQKVLSDAGIWNDFAIILCGDDVVKGKPDPEIYQNVIKKAGVRPEETMVLEDSANGIMAAYHAGAKPVLIPDLQKVDEEVRNLVFGEVTSMDQAIGMLELYST